MAHRLTLAVTTAAALSLAAGAAGCGSSSTTAPTAAAPTTSAATTSAAAATTTATAPAAAKGSVTATLTEFKIALATPSVHAGRVVFVVHNTGKVKHQFTVIRTTKTAAKVLSHVNPNDDIPGARGEIAAIAPGGTKRLVVKHLKAGHYAIVCALPGHYQAGMFADFTVV